jgi:hypothetical protein
MVVKLGGEIAANPDALQLAGLSRCWRTWASASWWYGGGPQA